MAFNNISSSSSGTSSTNTLTSATDSTNAEPLHKESFSSSDSAADARTTLPTEIAFSSTAVANPASMVAGKDQFGLEGTALSRASADMQTSDVSATHQKGNKRRSPLKDMAYSVVKDDEDTLYSKGEAKASAYVAANGAPKLSDPPPTDTFNVYAVDESVEANSANQQLASINAEVAANDDLANLQEAQQQTDITNTLSAIQSQQQAQSHEHKAKATAALTEDLGISIGAALIVVSVACYVAGFFTAGATDAAGIALDADAAATISGSVAADVATNAAIDASVSTAGIDAAEAASEGASEGIIDSSLDASSETASNASVDATEDSSIETADADADISADAAANSSVNSAAATSAATSSYTMTASQAATWSFMGATTLVMSTPAGTDMNSAMAKSLIESSHGTLSNSEADYLAMGITTVLTIVAGGFMMAPEGFTEGALSAAGRAASNVGTGVTTTFKGLMDLLTMSTEDVIRNAGEIAMTTFSHSGEDLSEVETQSEAMIAKSLLTRLYDAVGRPISNAAAATIKVASDNVNFLLSNPATAVLTALKVTFRVLGKMAETVLTGVQKAGAGLLSLPAKLSTVNGALGVLMAVSQLAESGLDLYDSVLGLEAAEAENQFSNDEKLAMIGEADATSTENTINACAQMIQQQFVIMNGMLSSTGTTIGQMEQPIRS